MSVKFFAQGEQWLASDWVWTHAASDPKITSPTCYSLDHVTTEMIFAKYRVSYYYTWEFQVYYFVIKEGW